MHRHQKTKKTKHDLHKTCAGIKKNKITTILQSIDPQPWVDAQTLFFGFYWCLCRFCASSGLFFLVFVDACAGFVTLTFTKHAQASKKLKKNKAWSSQNLRRHQKKQNNQNFAIYRPPALSRCSDFGFWGFFDACAGFVHLVVWFFCFFWCLCGFCDSNLHQTCTGIKKTKKNKAWSSQNLRRHQKTK